MRTELGATLAVALVLLPAPVRADDALARVDRAVRAVTTLRAELVQIREYPQLGLSDAPESGRLLLARGAAGQRVRLDIERPEPTVLVVEAGAYALYRPGIKQLTSGRTELSGRSGDALLELLAGDSETRAERFSIEELGVERRGGRDVHHLRFTPRWSGATYVRADVWIDPELWLPVAEELVEADSSLTRIELRDVSVGEPVDDAAFAIEVPADVERISG